ncbi:GCN5-related N-acetyltransferase [Emticicia oligotrophica DSM 17448]|uniref:GCN5-related N-acetyltransferase n=1 Tax=Emticicia oligotrophica (strain DSM 17448 / CIP 109782 / MTCC 6937 / GPTSA100-15) TaxID=929562 RepID=A0ABM5N044_EMTOG|nr:MULTISPECIES: GNAT family N-acetyltransferase [Emticicia]AFK02793.1 GCN5-related N-acetyltransferase [Emticicia oligotrophica DSM 17448]
MDKIKVIKATSDDVEPLKKIGIETFSETFASMNSEENMKAYLEESFANQKLLTELKNPNSIFYFAKYEEDIIGYLKINTGESQTELKNTKSLEIERIYVLKAYHGKNVGQLLYQKAIEVAQEINVDYVWLGVWEENLRAISFYKKNGFVEFDKHIFRLGDDEQTDIMMKLQMKK